MMHKMLVILMLVLLSGCIMIVPEQKTYDVYPQKVCVDPQGKHFIDCATGKLIADDAYKR